jgi:hypothetical protein
LAQTSRPFLLAQTSRPFLLAQTSRVIVEDDPEVLAPAFGAPEVAAGHGGGEAERPRGVTAHGARMEHLRVRDRAADHEAFQTRADGLDLGQFGHGIQPAR